MEPRSAPPQDRYMTQLALPRRPVTGAALIVAPLLVLGYGSLRLLGGPTHGPGPVWTVSHLVFLAAFGAFAVALPGVRGLVGGGGWARWGANVVAALAGLGLLAGIGQTAIDLVVGAGASDRAGMNTLYGKVYANEVLAAAFQQVGPILFFVGLPVLTILLATVRPRRLRPYAPVVVTVGMVLPSVDLDLLPVAALLMAAGLVPLGRRLLAGGTVPAGLGAGRNAAGLAQQGR
jgi:hypothetical protein